MMQKLNTSDIVEFVVKTIEYNVVMDMVGRWSEKALLVLHLSWKKAKAD